jgi:hypothetical protein
MFGIRDIEQMRTADKWYPNDAGVHPKQSSVNTGQDPSLK